MRFSLKIPLLAGGADFPDPRVAPAALQRNHAMDAVVPRFTDVPVSRVRLALEGVATQSVGVELWTPDEGPERMPNTADSIKTSFPGDLQWYEITPAGVPVVVTVGELTEVLLLVPTAGLIYLRATGLPAGASVLKAVCA